MLTTTARTVYVTNRFSALFHNQLPEFTWTNIKLKPIDAKYINLHSTEHNMW